MAGALGRGVSGIALTVPCPAMAHLHQHQQHQLLGTCRPGSQPWAPPLASARLGCGGAPRRRARPQQPLVLASGAEWESNLGVLSKFTDQTADDLSWAAQRVSPESFANRGLYVDPGVVAASGLLLLLLLMVSFQRILGLDKWVAEWFLRQQDRRRQEMQDTKQRLERAFQASDPPPTEEGGGHSNNGNGKAP